MIIYRILILTLLITAIYSSLIYMLYDKPEEQTKEETEERKNYYLQLQNMTTQEIILFKNKKEFIDTIKQYDTIKHFLKGTEEENNEQLIEWFYPGYKKL